MDNKWIAIEAMAIMIESLGCIYFLHKRFDSKRRQMWPQCLAWGVLVCWGLAATLGSFPVPVYSLVYIAIAVAFLAAFKHGSWLQKAFGVLILDGLIIGTTLIGAWLGAAIMSTSIAHTSFTQDASRFWTIVIIKAFQLLVLFALAHVHAGAEKHLAFSRMGREASLMLCGAALASYAVLFIVRLYMAHPPSNLLDAHIPALAAVCLFLLVLSAFLLYDQLARKELANIELKTRLEHEGLKSGFPEIIGAAQEDMRAKMHDSANIFIALRGLAENAETSRLVDFVNRAADSAAQAPRCAPLIRTGNPALDAVVNSKLYKAQAHGIRVKIFSEYPRDICVEDYDMCVIAGNLIDNAVEACERMEHGNTERSSMERFITFSFRINGKNLLLSVANSYSGKLIRDGERYVSAKGPLAHGIGLLHVDAAVNRYSGHVMRSHTASVFETRILLPLALPDSAAIKRATAGAQTRETAKEAAAGPKAENGAASRVWGRQIQRPAGLQAGSRTAK
ncbi:MAG: ATP-binding protein [Clostridiales Family XIII bacterium]|jgi:hypothetical protein|nr:ATP-binding protein [Clostridiales Family XIII bacterium]